MPFDLGMWTYSRQSQFALMTFTGSVDVNDAFAAAARLRREAGTTPIRLVMDIAEADFPERCSWVFMAVLEDVPVIDVVIIGASRDAASSFRLVGTSFAVPIALHATTEDWVASERAPRPARPRPPSPLLALTVS